MACKKHDNYCIVMQVSSCYSSLAQNVSDEQISQTIHHLNLLNSLIVHTPCILFLCWIKTGRGARFPKCNSRERLYNIDLQHEDVQWVSAESYVIRFDDSAAFTLESSSIQTCENLDNHLQSFTQWSNQHHTGYLASLCFEKWGDWVKLLLVSLPILLFNFM